MHYRSDIDGLRAVAVLLVVFYHCGYSRIFHGGYVGVDVFFVISGYLITRIIHTEVAGGKFSVWRFYERRIRRIFPALIPVYIVTLCASFFIMMPSETAQQARNALSSIAFISNIYFYIKFDYFDATSEFNALLHTWSLSVEEQFYIFFPPAFMLVYARWPRAVKPLVIVCAIASLGLSQWRVGSDASAAFYLVHYRAWELLAGSMLALNIVPPSVNRYLTNAASGIGVLLIAGSTWYLNSASIFPGFAALPSVLGAAMIIWAGQGRNTMIGSVLSFAPARFIGKISYSLYLWHWPVWVLGSQLLEPHSHLQRLAYIALAIFAAALSWRFVEQPFRTARTDFSSQKVVAYGALGMAAATLVVVMSSALSASYWKVSSRVEEVADFINYRADRNFRVGSCFLTSQFNEFGMFDLKTCLGRSDQRPNVLLMGDSHAAHFYPGLSSLSEINVMQATASGCRPVDKSRGELRCTSLVNFITDDFLPKTNVDMVVISARWQDGDLDALLREVKKIQQYVPRVVVFGPIVEYDRALPRVLARSLYADDPIFVDAHRLTSRRQMDAAFASAINSTGARYISIYDTVCPAGQCTLWTSDNNPIQSDYGHLTASGSVEIIGRLKDILLTSLSLQ